MTENREDFLNLAMEGRGEIPQGWRFVRNTDGSIGIFAPPPREGESRRTSTCVYVRQSPDLHELLGKLADHQAASTSLPATVEPSHEPGGLLSSRLRPNVECSPWVIDEVKKLEARIATTTERKGKPFGQVTVKHPVGPFHAPLYTFYPWPQPPYLDNVQECHTVYTSPQVPEVLSWKGLNLHSMADAFEQVIEAAAHRENPFVNPVTKQAQLALREFRLCIPAMQAIDAARKEPT